MHTLQKKLTEVPKLIKLTGALFAEKCLYTTKISFF